MVVVPICNLVLAPAFFWGAEMASLGWRLASLTWPEAVHLQLVLVVLLVVVVPLGAQASLVLLLLGGTCGSLLSCEGYKHSYLSANCLESAPLPAEGGS